ncbi:hypothetical protein KCU88_g4624, partial [Aureobasidium melanogenum]
MSEGVGDLRVDETTALLATPAHVSSSTDNEQGRPGNGDEDKPLPKDQIFYLCFARIVEPIAFFCIFPFINQMIWETGEVAQTDVGFYSGLIESLFSLTQMLLMIPWGRAADYWGRKPVLVSSLSGVAVATAIFGLSGALSNPATVYPRIFGHIRFLHEYPYALPTFATGAIAVVATVTSALFIKETQPPKSPSHNHPPPMSTLEVMSSRHVPLTLYIYGHVMLLAFAYTAIIPVFYFTPVHLGGFGFTPFQISLFMGIGGLSQAMWLLVVFPWLQARIGTAGVMRLCATAYPFFFTVLPLCNILLRQHLTAIFWVVACTSLVIGSGVAMSFTAIQLVLNDVSPNPQVLGTLNAIALTLVSGIRAFSPALFASLFAASVRSRIWGGHLIWIPMVVLALGFTVVCRWVPEREETTKDVTEAEGE